MNNFARVLRKTWRYRFTVISSILCALAVALLWGGNITAVYPFVEVVFKGQSMPEWIDEQVATNQTQIENYRGHIDTLEKDLSKASDSEAESTIDEQLAIDRLRLETEESSLQRNRYLSSWIHAYMPTDKFETLLLIVGFLLVGTVVKGVFIYLSMVLTARLGTLITGDLRVEFYKHTLDTDLSQLGENARGDLMNRFTSDVNAAGNAVSTLFGKALREPLKLIACLIGAAVVSWQLLLFSLLIAPLAAWVVSWLSKSLKRANRRAMDEMSLIHNTLAETLSGIKVVKAFTMEKQELDGFAKTTAIYLKKAMRIARYDALSRPATELMGIIIISMAILAGGYLALNRQTEIFGITMSARPLSLGSLILFYGFLAGVSDPARKISELLNGLQQGVAASDRVYEILDRLPNIVDSQDAKPLARHHRDIEVRDVHFSYDGEKQVLDGVSLRVEQGETVAIVGPNGCGKSTLTNLLLRFYDPTSGSLSVDGIDVRTAKIRDLRGQIGLVNQDTHLFDDTVLMNIRYGSPDATDAEVIQAAKKAHAHRFIEDKLADGYQTIVGPGGNRLSGGQRQRIALARAILRNPAILILDEATSQIDIESEHLIHKALEDFTKGRTTLIITHRLSTLAIADRIVVMNHGTVTDIGTHDELVKRCEFYRRLYSIDMQATA